MGLIRPNIGKSYLFLTISSTTAELVLQAINTAFALLALVELKISTTNPNNCSFDFSPYGTLAVSPNIYNLRQAIRATKVFNTLNPPIPESNTPIGLFLFIPYPYRLFALISGFSAEYFKPKYSKTPVEIAFAVAFFLSSCNSWYRSKSLEMKPISTSAAGISV